MNYINLKNTDNLDIIINVDRIDGIISDADSCKIYVGGSDHPFYVPDKINEIIEKIEAASNVHLTAPSKIPTDNNPWFIKNPEFTCEDKGLDKEKGEKLK